MKKVMAYIDNEFAKLPDNDQVYKYKLKLIEEVTERANEITHAGLKDSNVIEDLIISEYSDITSEYEKHTEQLKRKKQIKNRIITNIVGSLGYFVLAVSLFLILGFTKGNWGINAITIICSSVSLFIGFLSIQVIRYHSNSNIIMKQLSRVLIYVIVFSVATPLFLVMLLKFDVHHEWLVFIAAVIVGFIADSIYIEHKMERFAIIFHLLYIVPSFTMLYIILAVLEIIKWNPGWVMIPASFAIVAAIIAYRLYKHSKVKIDEPEEDGQWNAEN